MATKKLLLIIAIFVFLLATIFYLYKKPPKNAPAVNITPATENNKITLINSTTTNESQNIRTETAITTEVKDAGNEGQPRIPQEGTTTVDLPENSQRFIVPMNKNSLDEVSAVLLDAGFIKDEDSFQGLFGKDIKNIVPGGYRISREMNETQISEIFKNKPYMKWVIIPEGLRKEETADVLANFLGWNNTQKQKWLAETKTMENDYTEGVYYPDTYLIPIDETPLEVAKRLISKFNEKFSPYLPEFTRQNIKWTTGLTLASIVQRESANASDMPLIAGILWNRLENDMALNTDATLQYARGNTGNGWWSSISPSDKQINSPFNTYTNKGLPPHPICNPGITAIEAVLHPAQTGCLYYLHGDDGITHCAATYEEHIANIDKYLKN